ncbi:MULTISPECIES: hypothetical protein [Clostridium]|uniref:hypothetical protein n=1 Tax=Clostridium TaxID=1485 RepID=UPI0013FA0281|nr:MULTISPECIES: hypothetical protein [Clostridium]MBN1041880.1 hypothetical protein [Clostridium botulinum]MBY7026891.1 hypothetical protein [Clostridium botulinum]NFO46334.1 hypothetical protein [Clostridium botulinum]
MKRYLNKALIYQWFNSAKFAIIAGILFWGLYANFLIADVYRSEMYNIQRLDSNSFRTVGLEQYFILGLIFLVIYVLTFGNNKRNTEIFLCSGPYTKKQIKFNEFLCYLMTLGTFVLTYLYIAITFFIRNKESFVMINGYATIIMIEIIRIILFGILGIIIMLIIESMFSNSMVGIVFMIIIPISFVFSIIRKFDNYYCMWINRVMVREYTGEEFNSVRSCGLIEGYTSANEIRMRNLFIASFIFIMIIIISLFILNYVQRKNSLETNVGFFGSAWSKNIIIIYLPIAFGIILSDLIFGRYKDGFMESYYLVQKVSVKEYLIGFGVDFGLAAIVGIIIYMIIKKILKKLA